MGLMNALSKVGLVTLDENEKTKKPTKPAPVSNDELDKILNDTAGLDKPPVSKRSNLIVGSNFEPNLDGSIDFRYSPSTIYKDAGVAPTKYPAEKLIRVMDGLKTMDANTRKSAILAMDAADDDWSVVDVVKDAGDKIAALETAKTKIHTECLQEETSSKEQLAAQDAYLQEAQTVIMAQIKELEAQLSTENQNVFASKNRIKTNYDTFVSWASGQENALQQEVLKLKEIVTTFGG